jgi:hypothetical protein
MNHLVLGAGESDAEPKQRRGLPYNHSIWRDDGNEPLISRRRRAPSESPLNQEA